MARLSSSIRSSVVTSRGFMTLPRSTIARCDHAAFMPMHAACALPLGVPAALRVAAGGATLAPKTHNHPSHGMKACDGVLWRQLQPPHPSSPPVTPAAACSAGH